MDLKKLTTSIQFHEGLRLWPYRDTTGNLTIGYGRNLSGKGITNAEATALLGDDITDVIIQAEAQTWWPIIQNDDVRSRAMCEILFNVGLQRLNDFTKALAALRDGDFGTAADEFRASRWASQVGQRAVTLTKMIEVGQD